MTDEQTTEETPQIDSIAATEIEEMDARKRLAALKLLQARLDAVSEKRKARGDDWRNILTELTQTLHDAIDATIPITDGQCRKNLVAIKAARAASEEAKASKAEEIADLKAAIKRIEETMGDLISKDPSNQMGLDLGGEQTTWLTKEVADQVNLALTAKESRAASDGEDMAADLVALRQQLDAMGISAIMPDDEADEAEEAEEASASDGDASDDEPESTADEDDEGYEEDPTDFDADDNVISLAGNA
jgi:HAMP domain-containing protein